ncbi:MAG: Nif3-like dinuclear metal center hexameric protein [Bacillota bacterium]|jgi:hypothetical protein
MTKGTTVRDVNNALSTITGGRVPQDIASLHSGNSPFVVVKTSHIPGKAVTEIPGLVYGSYDKKVKKIAVMMTLTESQIELAGALDIDAIVTHHPVADAANSGGVTLKSYLDLYNIAVFEVHEAFHGLHPGLSWLHGHKAFRAEIAYGGVSGNIMFVGKALPEIKTAGDMVRRVTELMGQAEEKKMFAAEKEVRNCPDLQETNMAAPAYILVGKEDNPVDNILHIFPHTGFTVEHLESALREHPEIDTVLATISRVKPGHPLAKRCEELGLNFVVGNSHALEIFENGLPLAKALAKLLPDTEVFMFRDRVTATPLNKFGNPAIQEYADMIVENYLVKE